MLNINKPSDLTPKFTGNTEQKDTKLCRQSAKSKIQT